MCTTILSFSEKHIKTLNSRNCKEGWLHKHPVLRVQNTTPLPVFGSHWSGPTHHSFFNARPRHFTLLLSSSPLVILNVYNKSFVCKVCISLIALPIKVITQSSTITTKISKTKWNQNHKSVVAEEAGVEAGWHVSRMPAYGRAGGLQRARWAASLRTSLRKGNENWHAHHLGKLWAPASCTRHTGPARGERQQVRGTRVCVLTLMRFLSMSSHFVVRSLRVLPKRNLERRRELYSFLWQRLSLCLMVLFF